MLATVFAEGHLFLSKKKSKVSLGYLCELLQLGADPLRDPLLEGMEGKESVIYVSRINATLLIPFARPKQQASKLAKGLIHLLLNCPTPSLRMGTAELPHPFAEAKEHSWRLWKSPRRNSNFTLTWRQFLVVIRLRTKGWPGEIVVGIVGKRKRKAARSGHASPDLHAERQLCGPRSLRRAFAVSPPLSQSRGAMLSTSDV